MNSTADCTGNEFACDFLSLDDLSLTFGTASLNPLGVIEVNVYPNPADDLVTIEFNEMTGKTAMEQTSNGIKTTIDVQYLDLGTYFTKIIGKDGRAVHQQLIIQ